MEEHLKIVCIHICIIKLSLLYNSLFKGASGDSFTGLSAGSHTIDLRFTPAGTSQTIPLRQLRFTIGNSMCTYIHNKLKSYYM